MEPFKITMAEYLAISWALARIRYEIKNNLLEGHIPAAEKVVKYLKYLLERAEIQTEEGE